MLATDMSGTILIRENTLLPPGLATESEVFLPGWRVVKNLDGSALAEASRARIGTSFTWRVRSERLFWVATGQGLCRRQ